MEEIFRWDTVAGVKVPVSRHGRYLNHEEIAKGRKKARRLTSPYRALRFVIGDTENFICLDYAEFLDSQIIFDSAVHTPDSVYDTAYEVVKRPDAVIEALSMVQVALNWCMTNKVKHNMSGWNQDPYYFLRCVAAAVKDPRIASWRGGRIVPCDNRYGWLHTLPCSL